MRKFTTISSEMFLKKIFLSLFVFLLISAASFCQTAFPAVTGKTVFRKMTPVASYDKNQNISTAMLVSPSFYTEHLAFFCRQEMKLEKLTKIPFKFRLGSVEMVDYLEGKRR